MRYSGTASHFTVSETVAEPFAPVPIALIVTAKVCVLGGGAGVGGGVGGVGGVGVVVGGGCGVGCELLLAVPPQATNVARAHDTISNAA
jgi:hypothetical protein